MRVLLSTSEVLQYFQVSLGGPQGFNFTLVGVCVPFTNIHGLPFLRVGGLESSSLDGLCTTQYFQPNINVEHPADV